MAIASQSGALGEMLLARANELAMGLSAFVSLGNKADVSGNDLLTWWENDPRTRVILLYLESLGNPEHFAGLARRITRGGKPILAVKSGRSAAGAAATSSHTGSMAAEDSIYDAAFERAGIVRVFDVDDMFSPPESLMIGGRMTSQASISSSAIPQPVPNRI